MKIICAFAGGLAGAFAGFLGGLYGYGTDCRRKSDEMSNEPDNWDGGPHVVRERLNRICRSFGAHWDDHNNLARQEDGSFSCCGVFMEFGFYFRERYEQFQADCLAELGAFVSQCAESSNDEVSTAVCTYFLENVAGEQAGRALQLHLSGEALRFYEACSE